MDKNRANLLDNVNEESNLIDFASRVDSLLMQSIVRPGAQYSNYSPLKLWNRVL